RLQDTRLRKELVSSCRRFGLVVAGYSGRDASIMQALNEALEDAGAFPNGLFWLHRGSAPPFEAVSALLMTAASKGIEAGLVMIENFDETLCDLLRLLQDVDTGVLDGFAADRVRRSAAPRLTGSKAWPVIRFNGIPVTQRPTVCRIVECGVG